jgi:hypothetical protein
LTGSVNVGTTAGNIIGSSTGKCYQISSTTSLGLINGIFATSLGTVVISNNTIGAISTNAATAAIGYTFNGVYTAGAGGNFTVSNNTIGSASTTNSISIGSGSTTAIVQCAEYTIQRLVPFH